MKYAVIYYSKAGTTKKIAEAVKERFNADLYFVEPEEAYGSYISAVARVGKEKLTKKNPGLKTKPEDFSAYDIVFIGFPVWYGTMPSFEQEYVSKCDLKGKIVIPFVTAGANGKDSSLETVRSLCANSKIEHYLFSSMMKKANVQAWLDEIEKNYGDK